jgi:hypothetical protein
VLAVALLALLIDAGLGAARARLPDPYRSRRRWRWLTALLYLLQPPARLHGRLAGGLAPWRRRGPHGLRVPRPTTALHWSGQWTAPEERVRELAVGLARLGAVVGSGGDWDRWDLQVRGGLIGRARLRTTVEEHGQGRQLVRIRIWPSVAPVGVILLALAAAAMPLVLLASPLILAGPAVVVLRGLYECGNAAHILGRALREAQSEARPQVLLEFVPAQSAR